MDLHMKGISDILARAARAAAGDFAAFGIGADDVRRYRWVSIVGSESKRSEIMTFKAGQGVGGHAIRIGRPVAWNAESADTERLRRECPLMQAEGLCCAMAAPVLLDGTSWGVLLVGARSAGTFGGEAVAALAAEADAIVARWRECFVRMA